MLQPSCPCHREIDFRLWAHGGGKTIRQAMEAELEQWLGMLAPPASRVCFYLVIPHLSVAAAAVAAAAPAPPSLPVELRRLTGAVSRTMATALHQVDVQIPLIRGCQFEA